MGKDLICCSLHARLNTGSISCHLQTHHKFSPQIQEAAGSGALCNTQIFVSAVLEIGDVYKCCCCVLLGVLSDVFSGTTV